MEIVFKAGQSLRHHNRKVPISNYSPCSLGWGCRHSPIMSVLIETMRMQLSLAQELLIFMVHVTTCALRKTKTDFTLPGKTATSR